MKMGLYIYGAGGHGMVVADAAASDRWLVRGFVDDQPEGSKAERSRVVERDQMLERADIAVIVAVGDNTVRQRLCRELREAGRVLATVVHACAELGRDVQLGEGVFIGAMAVVNAAAQVGDGAIINTAAVIEHHCRVGAFAHIAPNATLCGGASVGTRSLVGANAVLLPGVTVGDDCTVGAGAVVTKTVEDGDTVIGNPARVLQRPSYPHDQHDRMTGDGTILA